MSWDFGSAGSGGQGWDPSPVPPTPQTGAAPTQAGYPVPGQAPGQAPGQVPPPVSSGGGGSARPPLLWLALGFVVAAAAVVLGVLGDLVPAIGGWVLGGPVAIGLFAVFVTVDGRRRAEPWYAASTLADVGRRLLVVACLAAVALNAWQIADYVSRQGGGA